MLLAGLIVAERCADIAKNTPATQRGNSSAGAPPSGNFASDINGFSRHESNIAAPIDWRQPNRKERDGPHPNARIDRRDRRRRRGSHHDLLAAAGHQGDSRPGYPRTVAVDQSCVHRRHIALAHLWRCARRLAPDRVKRRHLRTDGGDRRHEAATRVTRAAIVELRSFVGRSVFHPFENASAPGWRITTDVACAREWAPIWPSAARVSSIRRSIACFGPSAPSAPSPHRNALPAKVALAPSARARTTSVPLRTPLSRITLACPLTSETTAGSTSIDAGSASNCRPPWFETQIPSMPSDTALAASAGCMTPLSTSGRFQRSRKRAISSQVKAPPISLRVKAITSLVPAPSLA